MDNKSMVKEREKIARDAIISLLGLRSKLEDAKYVKLLAKDIEAVYRIWSSRGNLYQLGY